MDDMAYRNAPGAVTHTGASPAAQALAVALGCVQTDRLGQYPGVCRAACQHLRCL